MRFRDFVFLVLLVAGISQYASWRQQQTQPLDPLQAYQRRLGEVAHLLGWDDLSFQVEAGPVVHMKGTRLHEGKDLADYLAPFYGFRKVDVTGGLLERKHCDIGRREREFLNEDYTRPMAYSCVFLEAYDEKGRPLGLEGWPKNYRFRVVMLSCQPDPDRAQLDFGRLKVQSLRELSGDFNRYKGMPEPSEVECKFVSFKQEFLPPPVVATGARMSGTGGED